MSEKTLGQIAEENYHTHGNNKEAWQAAAQAVADHVRKEWEVEKEQLVKSGYFWKAIKDTPELDGTDNAHPAWWRGHESGVIGTCNRIKLILNGKDDGEGVASDTVYESIRRELLELIKERDQFKYKFANLLNQQHPATKFKVGDKGYIVTDDGKDIFSITVEEVFNAIRHKNENYKEYKVLSSAEAADWVMKGGKA